MADLGISAHELNQILAAFKTQLKTFGNDISKIKPSHMAEAFNKAAEVHQNAASALTRSMKRTAKSLDSAEKYTRSSVDGINEAFEEYNRGINRVNNGFSKLDTATKGSIRQQAALTSSLIEGIDLSNKEQDKLLNSIYKSVESFNLITKQADGVISTAWDLQKAQDDLAKDMGFFEKAIKNSKKGLDKDIKAIKEKQALGKEELTHGEQALLQLAQKYKLEDANLSTIKDLVGESRKQITSLQMMLVKQQALMKAQDFVHDKFGAFGKLLTGALSPFGMIVEGLTLFVSGLKGSWEQLKVIADSGMIHQFQQIKRAQLMLGVSAENLTKIFTENARNVSAIGGHNFVAALQQGQHSLEQFGLAPEAAADAISDFTKSAVAGGINIRDQKKLNKAVNSQVQAFAKLRATTGTNMAEFKAMNDEMMHNASFQEELNGVSEAERQSKIDGMLKLRQTFVNMGMSAQTAQKALMSIQDIGKQKVADRFDQAAKLQQAAALAGLSNAKQLADIYRKGKRATAEEKAILQQGVGQLGQSLDQMALGSFAGENIANALGDNLQGPLQGMLEAGKEQTKTADAIGQMSDKMVNALTEFSKVPKEMADALHFEGRMKQYLTDPMVRSVAGIALAITGLGFLVIGTLKSLLTGVGPGIKHLVQSAKSRFKTQKESHADLTDGLKGNIDVAKENIKVDEQIASAAKSIANKDCCDESIASKTASDKIENAVEQAAPSVSPHGEKFIEPTDHHDREVKGSPNKNRGKKPKVVATPKKGRFAAMGEAITDYVKGAAEAAKNSKALAATLRGGAKAIKIAGTAARGLATLAGGIFAPIDVFLGVINGMWSAFQAEDFLGMADDQTATIGQRIVVGIGGALKAMTFGFFEDEIDSLTKEIAGFDLTTFAMMMEANFMKPFTITRGVLRKISEWVLSFGIQIKNAAEWIWEGLKGALTSVIAVFGKFSSGLISGITGFVVDNFKSWLPDSIVEKLSATTQSMTAISEQADKEIAGSAASITNVQKQFGEENKRRDEALADVDAATQKTLDDRQKAIDEQFEKSQKAKVEATKKNTEIKTNNATTNKIVAEASNSMIDTSKAIGEMALANLNGAALQSTVATARLTDGTAKTVNAAPLNTVEAANDSSAPVVGTQVAKQEELNKLLTDLIAALNKTEAESLVVEKEQLVMLEALVKANKDANKIATDSVAKGIEPFVMRNSKLENAMRQ